MNDLRPIFSQRTSGKAAPLFIFEMANNHMGDAEHGLKMIKDIHAVSKNFSAQGGSSTGWHFAFKFQYRNLDNFIHPDYRQRMDLKYVKRFSETKLTEAEFLQLKKQAEDLGFITMCTPFDEASVDAVVKHGYDILKIASASSTDWPLLEKIAATNLPIIASTGGTALADVDKMVGFLTHRHKTFAIEHCVSEYPTLPGHLQLNQIDLFRARYPQLTIGFSTHEQPNDVDAIKLAVAKGAGIFEKHVAVKSDKYEINAYSSTPEQLEKWLEAARQAFEMCGVVNERAPFGEKELADIRQFQRGVFAKEPIKTGQRVDTKNSFFAFPSQPGQILANQMGKYTVYTAKEDMAKNAPVIKVDKKETRDKVYEIVTKSRQLLEQAKIFVSNQLDFEISHHHGIDNFYENGAVIITCVNREYAKKLILVFPGQHHPTHMHKQKEETFHVLYGQAEFVLDGTKKQAGAGDVVVVERGVKHSFSSQDGCIFEEISTTHYKDDSFYEDESIMNNQDRKTRLTYWID
jgi:sialic acid synthase SpsE